MSLEAGEKPKDVCREIGVHKQTLYNGESKYSGMEVTQLAEFRGLKEENRKLRQLVADQALDILVLKAVKTKKW